MTERQLKRFEQEMSGYAKEPVVLEQIKGTAYAFGSELACLRIFYKYRNVSKKDPLVGFAKNLNSWYFSIEMEA